MPKGDKSEEGEGGGGKGNRETTKAANPNTTEKTHIWWEMDYRGRYCCK